MINTEDLLQEIRARLTEAFQPNTLDITDDSAAHAGHGASGGHYSVRIVSTAFRGHSPVDCHRMVYRALGNLMEGDIHALSIQASAPSK